ncbi:hypothetical protein BDR07DRAFT_1495722 [Suillus spraguei]|nr:hypothetical protein BDR07DRAFT_1495722 [Suillus spraguei]
MTDSTTRFVLGNDSLTMNKFKQRNRGTQNDVPGAEEAAYMRSGLFLDEDYEYSDDPIYYANQDELVFEAKPLINFPADRLCLFTVAGDATPVLHSEHSLIHHYVWTFPPLAFWTSPSYIRSSSNPHSRPIWIPDLPVFISGYIPMPYALPHLGKKRSTKVFSHCLSLTTFEFLPFFFFFFALLFGFLCLGCIVGGGAGAGAGVLNSALFPPPLFNFRIFASLLSYLLLLPNKFCMFDYLIFAFLSSLAVKLEMHLQAVLMHPVLEHQDALQLAQEVINAELWVYHKNKIKLDNGYFPQYQTQMVQLIKGVITGFHKTSTNKVPDLSTDKCRANFNSLQKSVDNLIHNPECGKDFKEMMEEWAMTGMGDHYFDDNNTGGSDMEDVDVIL